MMVTRTGRFMSFRTIASPAMPPPTTTTWGNATNSSGDNSFRGDVAISNYSTSNAGRVNSRPRGATSDRIDETRDDHQHREELVARGEAHHDRHRDQRAEHPEKLLTNSEAGERATLRARGDVPLGDRVETRLRDGARESEPTREEHLDPQDGMRGRDRGADARSEERDGQQRRLGEHVAHARDEGQPAEGAHPADHERERVPAKTRRLTTQPKRQEERREARTEAHEGGRSEPPRDLDVPEGVERVQVALGLGEPGDLITHDLRGALESRARDSRADVDERRDDEDAGGAEALQDPSAHRAGDESYQRAEQRELRVEAGKSLLLSRLLVRPTGVVDSIGVLSELVGAGHLRN